MPSQDKNVALLGPMSQITNLLKGALKSVQCAAPLSIEIHPYYKNLSKTERSGGISSHVIRFFLIQGDCVFLLQ